MIVITGCPKAGTQYMALALLAMGLDVRHEEAGKDGIVSWQLTPGKKDKTQNIYLHQIREPLATMSSCQKISEESWAYINNFIKIQDLPLIERVLNLYYYWNLLSEHGTDFSYRVESFRYHFEKFCTTIQHPELIEKKYILGYIPPNVNSAKPYKKITWKKLYAVDKELTDKVLEMARRYGYDYKRII